MPLGKTWNKRILHIPLNHFEPLWEARYLRSLDTQILDRKWDLVRLEPPNFKCGTSLERTENAEASQNYHVTHLRRSFRLVDESLVEDERLIF